jgi:tetratricopeptide (TPR) repeat protein
MANITETRAGAANRSVPRGALVPDAHGNLMSGSPAATELYDRAMDRFLRFDPAVVDLTGRLVSDHPDVPLGHALLAYLCLTSTDPHDLDEARGAAATLRSLPSTSRERAHADAIDLWLRGNWSGAATRLDELLVQWPTDLLALLIGHQLDFFLGDQVNLRDRVGRSLGTLPEDHPHQGFLRGMHAFGLEETGRYDAALDAGMRALDAHADDVWALHAVAHVHEMRGDIGAGVQLMADPRLRWADDNLFTVHLWWHYALYLLEAGRVDEVLAIHDRRVHHDGSAGVPLELLDAGSLLWRLRLLGVDAGDRFSAVAAAWDLGTRDTPWYVFNDVHAVMALCGADRLDDAGQVLDRLAAVAADPSSGSTNRMMTAEVGLPVARAMVAHTEGRHDDVLADLVPIRRRIHTFGGSDAQRDVVQQTLLDSAARAGRADLAAALVRERLSLRPSSVVGWTARARLAEASGDGDGRTSALEAVGRHRAGWTAAIDRADLRP